MKILCELISRETGKRVATTELEKDSFGCLTDNPFPASNLESALFNSVSAIVTYRVEAAHA